MEKTFFKYKESATVNTKLKHIVTTCLTSLDDFLMRLLDNKPYTLGIISEKIISQSGDLEDFGITIVNDLQTLNQFPELLKMSINKALSLVNFNKYKQYSIDEQIDVDVWDLLRTYCYFEYNYASSLLAIMSADEAKKYIENQEVDKIQEQRNPENYFKTFEDLIKNLKTIIDNFQTQEAIAEVLDDDRMVFKITKCKWAEMLKDFDPEFGFAMLCSTDYELAKNYNPDFVLTRNNTLMEGDDYCDFCYHDTRTEKEITHPTDQFWKEYS